MKRCRADERAFSAWLICLIASGPAAATWSAWLRAWITASRVDFSKSIAPFTAFTRLGIRSCRRLSCTSICLNALIVWFLSETSPLYATITHAPTTSTGIRGISEPMDAPGWRVRRPTSRRAASVSRRPVGSPRPARYRPGRAGPVGGPPRCAAPAPARRGCGATSSASRYPAPRRGRSTP